MGILKIPRITTTDRLTITPDEGELLYDTTNGKIYKGNNSTVGGVEVGGGTGGGILSGTASGTDTYSTTITGATAYAERDAYIIRFTNGNTASEPTLQINTFGAKKLYRGDGSTILGGDIASGSVMLCVYNTALDTANGGFQCIGTSSNALFAYVTSAEASGITINKGMPVYVSGAQGERITVLRANNSQDSTSAQTVGIAVAPIASGQKGIIIMQGELDNLSIFPTSAPDSWQDGIPVYLGATAGSVTKTKPYAPNHLVYLGFVITASNGGSGRMYVRIQNGYELDEIHDVDLYSSAPTSGQFLGFDGTLWKNASLPIMVGATTLANGTAGLVPQPLILDRNLYLSGAGTWVTPLATGNIAAGLARRLAIYSADGTALDDTFTQSSPHTINVILGTTAINANRTITIPVSNADTEFVMNQGDQTIAGNKSFTGLIGATAPSTSNTVGTNINLRNIYNNTSVRTYSNITGGAFVGITFTLSGTITTGSLVRLSNVTGLSNLSTTTDYYVYNSSNFSARLAISYANAMAGIPITTVTGTYTGPNATMTLYASPGSGAGITFTTGTGITPASSIGSTISSVLLGYEGATSTQPSFELVFSNMSAGATTERMRLSNAGVLSLTNTGLELPKVHTLNTPESLGNRFVAQRVIVGTNAWQQGINYATSFTTAAYRNSYYNELSSAALNFVVGGGSTGNPTGTGSFHFLVPEVGSTSDIGYGLGVMSPLITLKRINSANTNSTSGVIIHGPRKPGVNTKAIVNITSALNILTISFNVDVSDLIRNQFVTISGVNSVNGLYNGVSGRIISVTNDTVNNIYNITMYSTVVDTYQNSGTLTPIVRTDTGYSNIYIAIEKDDDFLAGTDPAVGTPVETRVLWWTRGVNYGTNSNGRAGTFALLTGDLDFLSGNEVARKQIPERIIFGAHSLNIGIAEQATATSILNIGTGVTTSGNTKTINFGTGGGTGSTTNITFGTATTTNLRFFGSTNTSGKPTVTGAKGGNAALTSLCTALANLGLITNSTT